MITNKLAETKELIYYLRKNFVDNKLFESLLEEVHMLENYNFSYDEEVIDSFINSLKWKIRDLNKNDLFDEEELSLVWSEYESKNWLCK